MEPLSARDQRKLQDEIARQEKQERVAGQQKLVREGQLQKQQKVVAAAHEQVYQQRVSLMHSSKITSTCRDSRRCSSTSSHKVTGFHIWKQRPRSTPRLTSFKIRSLTSVAFRQKAPSTVSWLVRLSLRYDLQSCLCSYETCLLRRYMQNCSSIYPDCTQRLGKANETCMSGCQSGGCGFM